LLGAGVGPGDEVVTVSHSFIATANAIRYCGATPVFVDIVRETRDIDPALIPAAITERTKAILVVHQAGMPCDLEAVRGVGDAHGLPVVEDAACAAGSTIRIDGQWERIGRPRGIVACFSLHPRKIVSTGDGGMLTTNDAELDATFKLLRQHGMSVSDRVRHGSNDVVFEEYPVVGFNYRLTDIQAAVGREQLKRLDGTVAERRRAAARYGELLAEIPGVRPPTEPADARSNWQSYTVELPPDCDQRAVMQRMLDIGVSTRRGIMNSHREAPYRDERLQLPNSEWAQDRLIVLPLYHEMPDDDIEYVVDALRTACTP
jgi:dTDP-4-amino-4,6-dideoxygalactose transaminase